jgi:hypothetical protein
VCLFVGTLVLTDILFEVLLLLLLLLCFEDVFGCKGFDCNCCGWLVGWLAGSATLLNQSQNGLKHNHLSCHNSN